MTATVTYVCHPSPDLSILRKTTGEVDSTEDGVIRVRPTGSKIQILIPVSNVRRIS